MADIRARLGTARAAAQAHVYGVVGLLLVALPLILAACNSGGGGGGGSGY